jgi:PhzF family phenazine biosynthesis protein
MGQRIVQVDAFTDRAFGGNPAAVCVMRAAGDAKWMQNVAAEMNLAETAFLWPEADAYHLRWFTPTQEVDLCGHATLGSAHVLWTEGHMAESEVARFQTRSGLLTARRTEAGIELDFPADSPHPTRPPEALLRAMGIKATTCVKGRLGYLIELEKEAEVKGLAPDFKAMLLAELRPVIVTARSATEEFDFVSRFFAPSMGIDEDPVTGAAHCCLGPYWSQHLGKREMRAFQASSRGGHVSVRVEGDRVFLTGRAVTVMRGELV